MGLSIVPTEVCALLIQCTEVAVSIKRLYCDAKVFQRSCSLRTNRAFVSGTGARRSAQMKRLAKSFRQTERAEGNMDTLG